MIAFGRKRWRAMSRISLTASLPRVTTITISGLDARILVTSTEKILRARVEGYMINHLKRQASAWKQRVQSVALGLAERVIGVEEHRRLGIKLGDVKQALNEPKAISHQHSRVREIARDEFEPLFGDLWRGADIDHKRYTSLFADLCDGERTAGIDVADDALGSVVDDSLSSDPGCVDVAFGVDMDELTRWP